MNIWNQQGLDICNCVRKFLEKFVSITILCLMLGWLANHFSCSYPYSPIVLLIVLKKSYYSSIYTKMQCWVQQPTRTIHSWILKNTTTNFCRTFVVNNQSLGLMQNDIYRVRYSGNNCNKSSYSQKLLKRNDLW